MSVARFMLLGAFWLLFSVSVGAADDFPGRAKFPDIPVMEKNELKRKLDDVVVVDARSAYEFETLRVKSAINIPVAAKDFEQRVKSLRVKTNKPIVFYCNGRTCLKSYQAVKKSKDVGVHETYAYDAGIFEWVKSFPKLSELLGESPVNLDHLIATKRFENKLLDPDSFGEKMVALGNQSMVLDIRDKFQRAGIGFFPGKERWVSLDNTAQLQRYIEKAKTSGKTLLIYDEVGKQVRWLQYTLEKAGLKNYYFMHKGAKEYYRQLAEFQRKKTM